MNHPALAGAPHVMGHVDRALSASGGILQAAPAPRFSRAKNAMSTSPRAIGVETKAVLDALCSNAEDISDISGDRN